MFKYIEDESHHSEKRGVRQQAASSSGAQIFYMRDWLGWRFSRYERVWWCFAFLSISQGVGS